MAKAKKEEKAAQEVENVILLPEAEYIRRTKLDVSNPDYINPSLDHHKIG